MNKLKYVAPTLRAHGSVEKLTEATKTGNRLDVAFSANTPLSEITTS